MLVLEGVGIKNKRKININKTKDKKGLQM